MTFCALPSRPAAGLADSRIKAASHRLADALECSNEYQAYLVAAQAVAQDPQVSRLVATIRERRGGYSQDGTGDLQSQLESLPVMQAYQQSLQALRRLLAMVERDFGALARIRCEMLRTNRALAQGNIASSSHQRTNALSERIEAAVLWIKGNHAGPVSISELARRVSMSERNFLRRFKAEIGQTPHEYLARVRLENAQLLLVQTDLPIDKIARRCGLLNGDHLRKYFLKYLSVTPIEYRMLARERVVKNGVFNGLKSEM